MATQSEARTRCILKNRWNAPLKVREGKIDDLERKLAMKMAAREHALSLRAGSSEF
jgi:hypothetical protein